MRERRWVLVIALLLAVLILAVYFFWKVTRANDIIKEKLLSSVRPFLSQETDIEDLEMDLSGFHLKGVKIAPKDRSFTLEIDEVRLGYHIWNFIRYGFVPHKFTQQIVLMHPKIIVRYISPTNGAKLLQKKDGVDFRMIVEELSPLKRITLADAELIVEKQTGDRLKLAHSLNGWLRTSPVDSAVVRLDGNLFESEIKNLLLSGEVNLITAKLIRLNVQIQESEISPKFSFLVPDYIQINSGKMWGEGQYNRIEGASGFYIISDGSFSLKKGGLYFDGVRIRGDLKNRDIQIQGTVENFNGSPFHISGVLENILDPTINLNVACEKFKIRTFFKYAIPYSRFSFSGYARFNLNLNGKLDNPRMTGDFGSTQLELYGAHLHQFIAEINLRDSLFSLIGTGNHEEGMILNLNSKLDLTGSIPKTNIKVHFKGNGSPVLPDWYRKKVESSQIDLGIQVNGYLNQIQGKILGSFNLVTLNQDTIQYNPVLTYSDNRMHIDIQSNNSFHLGGMVYHPFTDRAKWNLRLEGLTDLILPFMNEQHRRQSNLMVMKGTLTGTHTKWLFNANMVKAENGDTSQIFTCEMDGNQEKGKPLLVDFSGDYYGSNNENLPFIGRGVLSSNELWIRRFEVGDLVKCEGHIPFQANNQLIGIVQLNNFKLNQVHPFLHQLRDYRGNISGEIRVKSAMNQTNWKVDLSLKEGIFHKEGPYHGELVYEGTNLDIRLCRVFFYKGSKPILVGRTEKTSEDSLRGEFQGEGIDFGNLILALTGKQNVLRGSGAFNVVIRGKSKNPFLAGSMKIKEGFVKNVSFQEMWIDFIDTLYVQENLLGGTLNILGGWFVREDGLTIRLSGKIPHESSREADISIHAKGNILGLLTELSPFIRKSEGMGELFLRLGSKLGNWVIGKGQLQLNNGKVELASVLRSIDHLNGSVRIHPRNRFVEIIQLTGNIEGETFLLTNELIDESSDLLDPLVFEDLGIQLGFLKLKTDGKGIHIHLPGLMEPDEKGWIKLSGSNSEEPFIIAGPTSSPLVRGTIALSSSQFTYPFLPPKDEEDSNNELIKLLESIDWDIHIVPRKDVHYVRNLVNPISNVYMDLLLKDEYGEINLQGIIREATLDVWGNLISTEGTIEFLDHYFRPETITFDYPRGATPILSGRSSTTVIDTTGMPSTVWLSLNTIDEVTGIEKEGGELAEIKFRLSADNPNLGRTEADLLAALGYSVESFKERAYDALGMRVENIVFRPILRPIEKGIRHHLGFDVVRFFSMFSRNIAQIQSGNPITFDPKMLLRRTRVMLGKYLAPGLFITYSGEVQEGLFRYHTQGLGFRHALTLEYTIRPDLFLEMEYTYDSQLLSDRREDKRIWIRHIFPF